MYRQEYNAIIKNVREYNKHNKKHMTNYQQKIDFIKMEIEHAKKNRLIHLLGHLQKELKQAEEDKQIFNS